jgi:preprotein translocase subunit SecF
MTSPYLKEKNIIDVVKYKWLWIMISLVLIIPGIVAMVYSTFIYPTHSPLKLGIDFTGGTMLQYAFGRETAKENITKIREIMTSINIENPVIQSEKVSDTELQEKGKDVNFDIKNLVSMRTRFLESGKTNNEIVKVTQALKKEFGNVELMQVSAVGPTLGKELFKNSMVALLLSFLAIVGYLTLRFKLDYAMFALFALFHDAVFVCGVFSIMGLTLNTQVDSLFITAILTVIGFSVHDTIVVFDRIRENSRFLAKKATFNEIVNASVNQTLARSLNTSLTTLLTLVALFFFGGETTKDFVLAMILGIVIGTYSSIFNASTLLAWWRSRKNPSKKFA